MSVTLDDLCLVDLPLISQVSTECLNEDPACPRNALLRTSAVFNPNDSDFTDLANGNFTAVDYKSYDIGGLFDSAQPGNGCPETGCKELDTFTQRAFQFTWSDCIAEDMLVNFCRGTNPVADPFEVMRSFEQQIRDVQNSRYILSGLGGILATAAADSASMIQCDFTQESYDGTGDLSIENLGQVYSDLACAPDMWIADHLTVRKLRGQGFEPYCCGDDGQVFNTVAELQDPNGIPIVTMDDIYADYFDPNGDGSTSLMIGLKNNSIAFQRTSENDTSERQSGFVPLAFNTKVKPCDPTFLYMNERAALHFSGYNYTGDIQRCVNPLTEQQLLTAGTNAYAPAPNARSGWDKSGVVFVQGAIPNRKAAPTP